MERIRVSMESGGARGERNGLESVMLKWKMDELAQSNVERTG